VRLGYEEHASALAQRIARALLQSGMRESFNPHDGGGIGARHFTWSALAVEMLEPDASARYSHLAPAPTGPASAVDPPA